jgi:glycosyltransferase involved in cell wall biosynthesis
VTPTVSIVLPTRNGAAFLRESLDSCLAQTFDDWELLAVNDGSTDETAGILDAYAKRDSRVVVVTHAQSTGLPRALNAGFSRARGELLTWTSDDNRFRPHALERLVAALRLHPRVDLVYTDYSVIDGSGLVVETRKALPPDTLAVANCIGASFMYRREVHEALEGFDTNRPLVEDYDFWLRAADRFCLLPLAEDLYLYRLHGASLSSRHDRAILRAHRALMRDHLRAGRWLPAPKRAAACVHLSRAALGRGEVLHALSDFSLGCRIHVGAAIAECAGRAYKAVIRRAGAAS